MPRLVETAGLVVRLEEHPGHSNQSVHGNWAHRGGQLGLGLNVPRSKPSTPLFGAQADITSDGHPDFSGPLYLRETNGDEGVNPSYVAMIGGERVFAKGLDGDEMGAELAAQSLNAACGPLVPTLPLAEHSLSTVTYGSGLRGYYYKKETMLVQQWKPPGYDQSHKMHTDGNPDEVADMAVFDFVIGNGDRHSGNWLVGGGGHVIPIDHSLAFNRNPGRTWTSHVRLEGKPLTAKQQAFLTRIVKAGPAGLRQIMPDRVDAVGSVHRNAKALLDHGKLPTEEEWDRVQWNDDETKWWSPQPTPRPAPTWHGQRTLDWAARASPMHEARLTEHPGHSDQKVHGNWAHGAVNLRGPLKHLVPMRGGMNACYRAQIGGRTVFVKEASNIERQHELAAAGLNDLGGGLVNVPRIVERGPHHGDPDVPIEGQRGFVQACLVTDWVKGRQIHELPRDVRDRMRGEGPLRDLAVFDFVIANRDRHLGNVLVDKGGRIHPIDNGLSFGGRNSLPREYLLPHDAASRSLTPIQKTFLTKVADADSATLKGLGVPVHAIADTQRRAHALLQINRVPSYEDWGAYAMGKIGGQPQIEIFESSRHARITRLLEHPGHSNQKVHGNWAHGGAAAGGGGPYGEPIGWKRAQWLARQAISLVEDPEIKNLPSYGPVGQAAERLKAKVMIEMSDELALHPDRLRDLAACDAVKDLVDSGAVYAVNNPYSRPIDPKAVKSNDYWEGMHEKGLITDQERDQFAIDTEANRRDTIVGLVRYKWQDMTAEERMTAINDPVVRDAICAGYVARWASTAGDNSPVSIAIQYAAAREFGLPLRVTNEHGTYEFGKPPIPRNIWNPNALKEMQETSTAAEGLTNRGGQGLKALSRTVYERTQREFAAAGVTHVTVMRGVSTQPPGVPYKGTGIYKGGMYGQTPRSQREEIMAPVFPARVTVRGNPLSSWTLDPSTAQGFGEYRLAVRVPVSRVYSTPRFGQGCLNEKEVILLGGEYNVEATQWSPLA